MGLDPRFRWFKIKLLSPDKTKKEYTYRGLSRAEIRKAFGKKTQTESDDYILECCVPDEDTNSLLGGSSLKLLEAIYKVSGLSQEHIPIIGAVEWLKDKDYGCYEAAAVISIPSLTLETLDNCDPHYYYKYIMIGKVVFEKMFGMAPDKAFCEQEKGEINTSEQSFPGMQKQTFSYSSKK